MRAVQGSGLICLRYRSFRDDCDPEAKELSADQPGHPYGSTEVFTVESYDSVTTEAINARATTSMRNVLNYLPNKNAAMISCP